MLLRNMDSQLFNKFRIMELTGALLLGLLSVVMNISIAGALFHETGVLFEIGAFFIDAMGLLSFGIPGYLFCASYLLASPIYRPDRIFTLSCSLIPFLTLTIGFVFIRDFDYWSSRFDIFYMAGKGGFNFFIILLAIIESLLIATCRATLFSPSVRKNPDWKSWYTPKAILPPPDRKALNSVTSSSSVTQASFSHSDDGNTTIRLPDMKPLATATVFNELESLSSPLGYKIAQKIETEAYQEIDRENAGKSDSSKGNTYSVNGERYEELDLGSSSRHHASHHNSRRYSSWDGYKLPAEEIFKEQSGNEYRSIDQSTKQSAEILKSMLSDFNIQAEITNIQKGPTVTTFEVSPAPDVKLSKIMNLQDNIALKLSASSMRIIASTPDKHAVKIEISNTSRSTVYFADCIKAESFQEKEIPVILGKDSSGKTMIADLSQLPHLLIAGAVDSGKSVFIHSLIVSIMHKKSPAECRFILIDPTSELQIYNNIPHLLTPVITETRRAVQVIEYCIFEMERRYSCLEALGVRDIKTYNRQISERGIAVEQLPYIVVAIDEFSDIISAEGSLARLASMGKFAGIHLVLATRISGVITNFLKSNISGRIAFMTDGKMDSRIILDVTGAERLLGKGDMLYVKDVNSRDSAPVRIQGLYISREEIRKTVDYLKTLGDPDYLDEDLF